MTLINVHCIPHSDHIWGIGIFQFPQSSSVIVPMISTDTPDSELWMRLDYWHIEAAETRFFLLQGSACSVSLTARSPGWLSSAKPDPYCMVAPRSGSLYLHIDAATLNWQSHLPARQKINQSSECVSVCTRQWALAVSVRVFYKWNENTCAFNLDTDVILVGG